MNRVIKFRAWSRQHHAMIPDISTGTIKIFGNGGDAYDAKDCDLMQYVGLKDKSGLDIYEGDIVSVLNYEFEPDDGSDPFLIAEVVFDLGAFKFKAGDFYHDIYEWWGDGPLLEDVRVVGNIHQDPSLLA